MLRELQRRSVNLIASRGHIKQGAHRQAAGKPRQVVWQGLKGQVFLGTDAFAEAMQQRLEQDGKHASREIPRLQRRALAKSLNYYRDGFTDRKQGMAAAYCTGDYTLQEVADAFEVHSATVSRAVNGQ